MSDKRKYRHEYKYLISTAQQEILKNRISGIMSEDSHAENGYYNIRSLYFDDYYKGCYYENENGTDPREKFRIRIYNHSDKRIALECKRKEMGKTLKTSCSLTHEQYESLVLGKILLNNYNTPELIKKLNILMAIRKMKPVVIVEYDRIPYIYPNGNVRVTFDTNISSSNDINNFFNEAILKRPVMPAGMQLMEVKFDEYLPGFIYRALQIENLEQTSYSKYYMCRKFSI